MFPSLLTFFWLLIQAFAAFSLIVPAIFCLIYFIKRHTKQQQADDEELFEEKDYAIIVSAHESPENLYALLQSLIQLNYTNYLVYVTGTYTSAADVSLHNEKLVYLRTARVYEPRFLHRFVIENFRRPHTHVVILDGNCLVDKNYLTSLNTCFNRGYQIVASRQLHQNKRGAGNRLQSFICSYHNFFSGSLLFLSGSSAMLSCPGMAFTVWCYKQCLKAKTGNIGFVPMLQAILIQCGQRIAFASGAVVYKQTDTDIRQLAQQHAQHVFDWLMHLLHSCKTIIKGLHHRDMNRFLSGLSRLRMPVLTSVIIGFACLTVNIRIHPLLAILWAGVLLLVPLYAIVTFMQPSVQSYQNDADTQSGKNSFESIALFEPEEGYKVIMQTV